MQLANTLHEADVHFLQLPQWPSHVTGQKSLAPLAKHVVAEGEALLLLHGGDS